MPNHALFWEEKCKSNCDWYVKKKKKKLRARAGQSFFNNKIIKIIIHIRAYIQSEV